VTSRIEYESRLNLIWPKRDELTVCVITDGALTDGTGRGQLTDMVVLFDTDDRSAAEIARLSWRSFAFDYDVPLWEM
jgi:hypothetical protein